MTPKEKAKELVDKFKEQDTKGILFTADFNPKREQKILDKAKSFALIAVDEMIEIYVSACVAMGMSKEDAEKQESKYLQEVKQEIQNL
jgi:ArsR family metal-binding transcriptional regulator